MPVPLKRYVLAMVALLGACGDNANTQPAFADAPPSIDAAPPAFVGRWNRIATGSDLPGPQTLELTADGRIIVETGDVREEWTWQLTSSGQLHTVIGPVSFTYDHLVDGEQLMLEALLPAQPLGEIPGTYVTRQLLNGGPIDHTVTLGADMTATSVYVSSSGASMFEGTWMPSGLVLELTGMQNGQPASRTFAVIPGKALGRHLYERLP